MTANKQVFWIVIVLAGVLLVKGSWIQLKAQAAQWLLQDAWQQTQQDGGIHKPWKWADHWPVARLKVPQLQVDQIVLEGDSGNVLAFAPGHNVSSAIPKEEGTVVISGHRDTHFRFMQYLKQGQLVEIETSSGKYRYRIAGSQVVDANNARIDVATGINQLLLVTCYPFDASLAGGPLRYVVTAVPETPLELLL